MISFATKAAADMPFLDTGRKPGTGRIVQSLALTMFTMILLLAAAGLVFWNAILPFYGLLYLWGAG